MSLPNQTAAFPDCAEAFERASQAAMNRSVTRVCFATESEARVFRFRLQHYRALLRRDSKRIYPTDDPRYERSEFDSLICKLKEDATGEWWVYIESAGSKILAIEDIPIEEAPSFDEPLLITHRPESPDANT